MEVSGTSSSALSRRLCLAYGMGSLGTGTFSTVPGLLLLYFMVNVLGIPAALAGVTTLVSKLWDMSIDPLLGTLSDRTHTRWGRRRPWLLAGAVIMPVFLLLLFSPPPLPSVESRLAWVTVMFVLAATGYSVFQVPYVAMPAEMTDDHHQRTVVVGWRIALMTVGILAAGALAPVLVKVGGGGLPGYRLMAAVMAVACAVAMLWTFFGTASARSTERNEGGGRPLREQLAIVFQNRAYMSLVLSGFVQMTGIAAILASVPFFAQYVLRGDQGTVTVMFVCLVLPAVLTTPAWVALSRRLGKRRCYQLSVAGFAALDLTLFFASPDWVWAVYLRVALMGTCYAGTQLFPFAMLPDAIEADYRRSGQRREGVFSGLWTGSEQCGMALGGALAGVILGAFGFLESMPGQQVIQPESAVLGIRIVFSLVPAAFLFASVPIVSLYPNDIPEVSGS